MKEARFPSPWQVLAVGTLAVFAALGLARFGYSVVLPAMQQSLALDNTQAGLLASLNLAGYLAMSALGGALASRFGARLVIAGGLVLVALGMGLTGLADGFLAAAGWRALTGIGSGAANVAVMGMWGGWFAPERRGFAAGIAVTGSSLALIITGPLAPRLLAAYGDSGWRACWLVFAVTALVIALLALAVLREPPGSGGIDLGTGYSGRRTQGPALSWGQVYRSRTVWHLGLVYVACGFSYIIYLTFFVKRLMADGGYSRAAAGDLFMLMGWASLACGLLWGTVSDRIGRRRALIAVYLLHATAFALFALWPTPAGFTLSALLFGISAWSIPAIMAAACGDTLGPQLAPAGLGFVTLFFGCGQAVAPGLAGLLADRAGSFTPAYLLAAVVALAGAAGAASLPQHPSPSRRSS